jgi:PPOX class probable F420-dependent enzyme
MADQRGVVRMDDAEVAATLAERGQVKTVATLLPDGQPHLTAVWYGFTADGTLGFTTYAASQKARNLGRDPRITILVECGGEHSGLRGVQIAGRARLSSAMPVKLELSASIAARYPGRRRPADPEQAMAKRVAVLVSPVGVTSWDHRKLAAAGSGDHRLSGGEANA